MEERIIDDEFGRGIRLKKTKDGYVDATDELAPETEEERAEDEVEFSFPVFDVDDEELVGLTPEEALALQKRREEEKAECKEKYAELCAEGQSLLEKADYLGAENLFKKAMKMDIADETVEATLGFWRAKTEEFAYPDRFAKEYVQDGVDEMEYDLGYKTLDALKEAYKEKFAQSKKVWEEKSKALLEKAEEKIKERKEYLQPQVKSKTLGFVISALPMLALLITTIVLAFKNFSVRGSSFIIPTAICAGVFLISVFVFTFFANKFINVMRLYKASGKLYSSDEGKAFFEAEEYVLLYGNLSQE